MRLGRSRAKLWQGAWGRGQELGERGFANTDMHGGNLSFTMLGSRVVGLAPVYDMLPAQYAGQQGEPLDCCPRRAEGSTAQLLHQIRRFITVDLERLCRLQDQLALAGANDAVGSRYLNRQ
jgi:hypothetical protein